MFNGSFTAVVRVALALGHAGGRRGGARGAGGRGRAPAPPGRRAARLAHRRAAAPPAGQRQAVTVTNSEHTSATFLSIRYSFFNRFLRCWILIIRVHQYSYSEDSGAFNKFLSDYISVSNIHLVTSHRWVKTDSLTCVLRHDGETHKDRHSEDFERQSNPLPSVFRRPHNTQTTTPLLSPVNNNYSPPSTLFTITYFHLHLTQDN